MQVECVAIRMQVFHLKHSQGRQSTRVGPPSCKAERALCVPKGAKTSARQLQLPQAGNCDPEEGSVGTRCRRRALRGLEVSFVGLEMGGK